MRKHEFMTPRLTKQCRAPRQSDAYPCKNPTSEPGATCSKHHGLDRIPEGESGPKYIDGYHDHLIFRRKSRVQVHPAPGRWADKIHDEAKKRYTRVDSLLDRHLTQSWFHGFEEQAASLLTPAVLRKTLSAQACRRCDRLALAARYALESNVMPSAPCIPASLLLVSAGLPCIGVENLLIDGLDAVDQMEFSPTTAGRALQLVGVQGCRRQNRPVLDCYCARDIIRHEGEEQLRKLLKYGAADWTALGELDLAA